MAAQEPTDADAARAKYLSVRDTEPPSSSAPGPWGPPDEPQQALIHLSEVFWEGNAKHGMYGWKQLSAPEFFIKAQRHYGKRILLGQHLDQDSGHPHLIHAAADLLIAAELELIQLIKQGVGKK